MCLKNIIGPRCWSRWETLDRGQYPFQPIKFVNLVVPSPCETKPYNKASYYMALSHKDWELTNA